MRWEYTDRAVWILTGLMIVCLPISLVVNSWLALQGIWITDHLRQRASRGSGNLVAPPTSHIQDLVPPWTGGLGQWRDYLVELSTVLIPGLGFALGWGVLFFVVLRWLERLGRRPQKVRAQYRTTEPRITPLQVAVLHRGHPHPADVMGLALLQLSKAGVVSIDHACGTNEWVLTPTSSSQQQWQDLPEELQVVSSQLRLVHGGPPRPFDYPQPFAEACFRAAFCQAREVLTKWADQEGVFHHRVLVTQLMRGFCALAAGTLVVPWLLVWPVAWGLYVAGLGAVGFMLPNAEYERSRRGALLAAQAEGYADFLWSPQGADLLVGEQGQQFFEDYLLHAVALGRLDQWVRRYQEVTGVPAQLPTWLPTMSASSTAPNIVDSTHQLMDAAGWFAREYIRVVAGEPRRFAARVARRNRW